MLRKLYFARFTQYFCFAWVTYFFLGGLWATNGHFLNSGGGTTFLGLFPPLVFLIGFLYLEKNKSTHFFTSAVIFWVGLVIVNLGYQFWVRGMEHWPFGLAVLYVFFTFIAILQTIALCGYVHWKKGLRVR